MTTQPEALRLLIEDLELNHEFCPKEVILHAAAELRRLYEVNQELLEVLDMIVKNPSSGLWHNVARAAIAKATGETK